MKPRDRIKDVDGRKWWGRVTQVTTESAGTTMAAPGPTETTLTIVLEGPR